MSQFRKAERSKAKLRLALAGTAGSGKTYSALTLAKELGGKVAFIDSENGSGDLYATMFDYDILTLTAPFSPERYVAAIKAAEEEGYETIIVDSLSHAWAGVGGTLEEHDKWTEKDHSKNSYTAWRKVTPAHNALVNALIQSKAHVIATLRSKSDYAMEMGPNGKMQPRKVGLAPVQREGIDFEFTAVFDIDADHDAKASKDRTGLFSHPLPFRITEDTGKKIKEWLESGKDAVPPCNRCRIKDGVIRDSTGRHGDHDLCGPCTILWQMAQAPKEDAKSDIINEPKAA